MQMSMVSYYNPATMYRHHQQAVTTTAAAAAAAAQFHAAPMHPHHTWYHGYHHTQGAQVTTAAAPSVGPTTSYCMQDEQVWHQAPVFHPADLHDFVPSHHQQLHHQQGQMPSPPMTVSGSDMSSPGGGGAGGGSLTPPQQQQQQQARPAPVRSPFEWIKKTSYQSQPNPGKTRTRDKYRVVYTDHQRIELEKEFMLHNRYITIGRKQQLSLSLGLSERQIKIWFQNRRAKERKLAKKRMEENKLGLTKDCAENRQYHHGALLGVEDHFLAQRLDGKDDAGTNHDAVSVKLETAWDRMRV